MTHDIKFSHISWQLHCAGYMYPVSTRSGVIWEMESGISCRNGSQGDRPCPRNSGVLHLKDNLLCRAQLILYHLRYQS